MNNPVGNSSSKGVVLLVATIASFIFPFMGSAVNIALPSLGKELSLDAVMLGWIANSYLLSSATFLVPLGRIADIYGRKKIFTCGIAIFTLSSFLSGMASSVTMLISCRVLQGIGGAMLAGTAVALLTTVFPANERGKVLGINVAATYIGLSIGPVLGGVLTQHLGWRSIFLLSALLGLAVIGVVLWKLKGEWTDWGKGREIRCCWLRDIHPWACSAGIRFYAPTSDVRSVVDCRRRHRAFGVHQVGNENQKSAPGYKPI